MTHQNRSHKITFKERPRKTRERIQKHHLLQHSSREFRFFFMSGQFPLATPTNGLPAKGKLNDCKPYPNGTGLDPKIFQTTRAQHSVNLNRIRTNSNRLRSRKKEMNTGSSITIRVSGNKSNCRTNPFQMGKSSQSPHGKPTCVGIDNSTRTNPSNTNWENSFKAGSG